MAACCPPKPQTGSRKSTDHPVPLDSFLQPHSLTRHSGCPAMLTPSQAPGTVLLHLLGISCSNTDCGRQAFLRFLCPLRPSGIFLAQQAHDLYCCVHLIDSLPRGQGPVYSRQHPRLLDLSYLPHPQQRQRILFSNTRVTLLPVCFPVFAFSFPYLPRDPLVMSGLPEAKQCLSPRPTMAPSLYTETLGGYFQLTSATVRMKYMDGC